MLLPVVASASIGSFFAGLFSHADAASGVSGPNSQNLALLEAPISPNQDASSTTGVSIISGTSLLPQENQSGTSKNLNNDQISLYVVHSGDTLPAIAKMFGVSVNTIRWGNDIKGNTITVGQTLVILPVSGVEHTVKKGDTLQSIAREHKGNVDEIVQYNNLESGAKLVIGETLIVPEGIDAEINVSSSPRKYSNQGVGSVGLDHPVYDGYYMRPIIGGIKTQGIHGHNAVDLASAYGSDIFASAGGNVVLARDSGWNGGYGEYIIIQHDNGTQTVYGHLSKVIVSVGDAVSQGEVIGKMGQTGHATGVHLHFEIRGARNPF